MKSTNLTAIVLLIFLFAFRIWQSTGCLHFSGFYLNPLSIKINVESQRHLDIGTNQTISKSIHNKFSAGIFEVGKDYSGEFSPNYLLEILGPLGFALSVAGIAQLVKQKNKLMLLHLMLILIIAAAGLLPIDPKAAFYAFSLSVLSFPFWSVKSFTDTKVKFLIFVLLTMATVIYYMFAWQMQLSCNEIFFN